MQGFISSVGSIDTGGGGQGGDDERFLKIVFDLSNITPSAYGESPNIRYSYRYTGYPSCYIVDSLGNEEAESLANVLHYYLIPVASNDEENTGVTCEFDGLMCEGIIRSETNNLQSATFYFMWYVDLNQDYLIIKNNLTYHELQAIPEPLLEKYINVLVDLTGITPTTEVVNGKTYNKFTFAQNKLGVRSYSNSGPLEIIDFSELIFYKTMPISNNNNDMGLYMSYDGTTFNGYVLSQETTLTEVSFMFDFYQVSQLTSFIWKNYIDMVLSSGGGGGGSSFAIPAHTLTTTTKKTLAYVNIIPNLIRSTDYKYTYTDEDNSLFTLQSTGVSLYTLLNHNNAAMNTNATITLNNVYQYPMFLFYFSVKNSGSDINLSFRVDLYLNNSIIKTYTQNFTVPPSNSTIEINANNQVPYNTFFDKIVITYLSGPTNYIYGLQNIGVAAQATVPCIDSITFDENTFYHLYAQETKTIYSINNKPGYAYFPAGTNKLYNLTTNNYRNYLSLLQYN